MPSPPPRPVVAAIDMGYGHLRAAAPLADALGVPLLLMDRPPLGQARDAWFWWRTRALYEPLSRWSQVPGLGAPLRELLTRITAIPEADGDLSAPTAGTRWMERAARAGAGRTLAEHLRETGSALLATFYAAPILAELHGAERLHCVVTDADVNRVWAPPHPAQSRIRYYVPSEPARRRIESYGVAPERIRLTGFPLPHDLVGGREMTALRRNLAARLGRIDPGRAAADAAAKEIGPVPRDESPPLLTFAIGGAGAQVGIAVRLVRALAGALRTRRLALALVAGRRRDVARRLRAAIGVERLTGNSSVEILEERDTLKYLRRFNALLARTDVLWTKPSEMTFFAALGLPVIAAPPVGVHEERNLRWSMELGAALEQGDPDRAGDWLPRWIEDGTLARAAWNGYRRLPRLGLYDIVDDLAAS
ncbi:MAG TPA: hypothetical protein VKB92_15405 [Myxococcales bacterium]|nr:hypothetical protein [Myxococcales bacterium]